MAIPRVLARCLVATALLIASGTAQATTTLSSAAPAGTNGVVFIYPTKDQIYNFMDTVNVTYTSPFPTPNLFTFCNGGKEQKSMQRAVGYNGTIPYILNFTSATPCWFNLRPGTAAGFGANSEVFTIIGQERGSGSRVFGPENTPTISPPPFTTSPGGSLPGSNQNEDGRSTGRGSTETIGSVNTSTADPALATGGRTSISTAASAGIGIGVGVGVLALGLGGFAWWWKRRGKNRAMQGSPSGSDGTMSTLGEKYYSPTMGQTPVVYSEMGSGHGPLEIGSSGRPGKYEMAG
ncbi:hypothetical protein B0T14DRAFT_599272 [Immersiella caudata]|uniref:Uncharacterized protein n=1 Tax=Immersiella caudata TaxID=314043 RepID=A0AA40CE87_9PEZI|nr:hypothetical protein B0T14DRAFT_599272 [Immersiella caudata]